MIKISFDLGHHAYFNLLGFSVFGVSIPIFPEMEQKQIDFVIECVKLFFK
jgi:hypothetical protein